MLVIRPKQFTVLETEQTNRFLGRVIEFLYTHFEDERNIPDEQQRQKLLPLVHKARDYGLTTEQQAVGYILAAKHLGEDFDEAVPEATTILANNKLNGDQKLDRLQQLIK
jgi:hypothetical protein